MSTRLEKAAELGEKLRALASALTVPPKPELPPKLGYKWALAYTWGESGYQWEMVYDPEAVGTAKRPISFAPGMAVNQGWFYTDGIDTYVCILTGTPEKITDTTYFEKWEEAYGNQNGT